MVPLLLAALLALIPVGLRGWIDWRESDKASALAPESGRYVKADDVVIFIQEHGPADGPPVLLIHGAAAWSGTWRDTQPVLAEAGFRVISVDLPPFGFSQRPADGRYDRPRQAGRLLALLDTLELDRVSLVGHSFGGGPTLETAMMAPERVRCVVLVAAAIGLDAPPPDPKAVWVVDTPWARELAVASTFQNPLMTGAAMRAWVHDPSTVTSDRVAIYQEPFSVQGSTPAVGRWVRELVVPVRGWSHDSARIAKFGRPVQLIWGRQDTVTPPAQAERLDVLLPDSELAWMDGVGHLPHVEDTEAFHRLLVPFLEVHGH